MELKGNKLSPPLKPVAAVPCET